MEANMLYIVDTLRSVDDYIPAHYHNCHELVWYLEGEGCCRSTQISGHAPDSELTVFLQNSTLSPTSRTRNFRENSLLYFSPMELHDEKHTVPGNVFAIGFTCSEP